MFSFIRNSKVKGILTPWAVLAAVALFTVLACGGGGGGDGKTIPTVTSTIPDDGATEVSVDADIAITFSEAMNQSSVQTNLTINPDPGTAAYSWLSNTLTVNPDSSLAVSTAYTVTVGAAAEDAEGTAMGSPFIFGFTTVTRPIVVGTIPANLATAVATTTDITITFSKTMDQSITENAISISGYSGTQSYNWTTGSVVVISLSPDLASDIPYTVSVGAFAEDSGGTSMGTSYNFTFSTGPVISGAIVSGTIFDDLESSHDDDLTGAYAILLDGPPWDGDIDSFLNTGSGGFYQFNYVQNGSYYPAALLDTNAEDGEPNPRYGDAIGEWSGGATALTVNGTDRTGIDITLVDPEAISGNVFYSGMYSSQVFSAYPDTMYELQVYAWESTTAVVWEAEMTLGSSPIPSVTYTVATYYGGGEWVYGLNPYLNPELSISGKAANGDTFTQTFDEYIPPGDYQVLGYMDVPDHIASDTAIVGFADNLASIDNTGDDAGGIDITLYDTIEVQGDVLQVGLGGDAAYTTATVTLLGWPLFAPISNEVIGSDTSAWTYPAAPLGLPVAFHSEPDPADASSLMAVNKQYINIENADLDFLVELRVMERATMDTVAAWAGTTIDPTKAQIVGTVVGAYSTTLDDNHWVTGAMVTISTGDHVDYWYTDSSFGAPFTQYTEPNFFIFNVDPPPDEKATLTFSHPDSSIVIDSVTVPVRADELTMFMHFDVSDPGGLAQGVTISGSVEDAAHALVGPGVTMTLTHEDGTVLGTTLTDASSEYAFNNVPSLMPVYLTGSKTGYVPLSISVFPAHTTPIAGEFPIDSFLLFSESMALGLTSLIPGINEPSWNSTMQSNSWFLLEARDSSSGWDAIAGVTFSTSAPGALIYYWDDAADMYTSSGSSRGYSTDEMAAPAIGYAPSSSAGLFSFNATGTIIDSVNVVLTPGEMLIWYIEQ